MVERTREDEVLVMASDGLWDVIGNQEAADMAVHSLQVRDGLLHSGFVAACWAVQAQPAVVQVQPAALAFLGVRVIGNKEAEHT
jgi:hypothetical protein